MLPLLPSDLVAAILELTDLRGLCAAALLSKSWRNAAAAARDALRLLEVEPFHTTSVEMKWPCAIAVANAPPHNVPRLIVAEEKRFSLLDILPPGYPETAWYPKRVGYPNLGSIQRFQSRPA